MTGLLSFTMNLGLEISQEEIAGVLRRFDRDRDGMISYTEFVDSILPTEPKFISLNSPVKGPPRHEPERGTSIGLSPVSPFEDSQRRRSPRTRSPLCATSPPRATAFHPREPMREDLTPT